MNTTFFNYRSLRSMLVNLISRRLAYCAGLKFMISNKKNGRYASWIIDYFLYALALILEHIYRSGILPKNALKYKALHNIRSLGILVVTYKALLKASVPKIEQNLHQIFFTLFIIFIYAFQSKLSARFLIAAQYIIAQSFIHEYNIICITPAVFLYFPLLYFFYGLTIAIPMQTPIDGCGDRCIAKPKATEWMLHKYPIPFSPNSIIHEALIICIIKLALAQQIIVKYAILIFVSALHAAFCVSDQRSADLFNREFALICGKLPGLETKKYLYLVLLKLALIQCIFLCGLKLITSDKDFILLLQTKALYTLVRQFFEAYTLKKSYNTYES